LLEISHFKFKIDAICASQKKMQHAIGFILTSVPSLSQSNYLCSVLQEPLATMVVVESIPYYWGLYRFHSCNAIKTASNIFLGFIRHTHLIIV